MLRFDKNNIIYKIFQNIDNNYLNNSINIQQTYNDNNINSFTIEALSTLIEHDIPNYKCSRLYLYYNERQLNNSSNLIQLGINNIKYFGICSEDDWPYDINNINIKPQFECYKKSINNYSINFYNIKNDLSSMKKSIDNNEPFMVSINIYNNDFTNNIIKLPKRNDKILNTICIIVYGYDDRIQCFLIKTCSTEKKEKLYLPYRYLLKNEYCSDLWILVARYYNINIEKIKEPNIIDKSHINTDNISLIDLRNKFGPIYDQGRLNSCSANAICSIFNYDIPDFYGSRLFLYYNERLLNNNVLEDTGAYLSDGIESLKIYGLCSENDWKYDISKYNIKPPDYCYEKSLKYYLTEAFNIDNNLNNIKACLINNEPIVLGIAIYESFETISVSKTGIIPMPDPNERFLGGHAIIICGFDDNKKIFIARNSWGIYWGDKGYFYIPYDYILNPYLTTDLWIITKNKKNN